LKTFKTQSPLAGFFDLIIKTVSISAKLNKAIKNEREKLLPSIAMKQKI
jgi:hypothetical protein